MKITLTKPTEFEVAHLKASCGVRYWEDATVNGENDEDGDKIPMRNGDYWEPVICLETGKIEDWPEGTTASIHYKVCDDGSYTLLSPSREKVSMIEGYVPDIMAPKEGGYGDYVIMDISSDGTIDKWTPSFEEWERRED